MLRVPVIAPNMPEWVRKVAAAANQLMNGNLNAKPRLASAPDPAVEGDSYYDLTLHKERTYDGTVWRDHW